MAFSTTQELRQYVEKEMGHQVDDSSDKTDILSHLDRAHKIVCAGGGILNTDESGKRRNDEVSFVWAKSKFPKIITLLPAIEDSTVSVTSNSATATLSAVQSTNCTDWHIKVDGDEEVYRISSHTAGSNSLTLDSVYVETTDSAATCDIFKLAYSVGSSDILSVISPLRCKEGIIPLVDQDELLDKYPITDVGEEFPSCAAVIHESSGTLTVQFSSYPDSLERLELSYIPIPTTLNETNSDPIIPAPYRLCIAELACYFMLNRIDDSRAAAHLTVAREIFDDLVEHNLNLVASGDPNFGRVIPTLAPGDTNSGVPSVQTDYEIG